MEDKCNKDLNLMYNNNVVIINILDTFYVLTK